MKSLYQVVYKSSGVVANRFSNLADAKYWVQQNDTLYTGENGKELQEQAGMYEIRKVKPLSEQKEGK
jgi:hypothetical protein